jgi:hypothetical protein
MLKPKVSRTKVLVFDAMLNYLTISAISTSGFLIIHVSLNHKLPMHCFRNEAGAVDSYLSIQLRNEVKYEYLISPLFNSNLDFRYLFSKTEAKFFVDPMLMHSLRSDLKNGQAYVHVILKAFTDVIFGLPITNAQGYQFPCDIASCSLAFIELKLRSNHLGVDLSVKASKNGDKAGWVLNLDRKKN